MPPEWAAKAESEYRKYADQGRNPNPDRVRFVTYTPRFGDCEFISIRQLEKTYDKALVDARKENGGLRVETANVRGLLLHNMAKFKDLVIDGRKIALTGDPSSVFLGKEQGKWAVRPLPESNEAFPGTKYAGLQGPIDDAFMAKLEVVPPSSNPWFTAVSKFATADHIRFAKEWDKYFRGALPVRSAGTVDNNAHLVLFGDPGSNPLIKQIVDRLPITWTQEKLMVNGTTYDPKTHIPVLIYPNPLNKKQYVVINSGHTFHEAELKGTNAGLYPRLGDWAVLKLTPTAKDPLQCEVVAAGLFDENWRFEKK